MNKENMANGGSGSSVSGEYIAQRTDLHGGSAAAASYVCVPEESIGKGGGSYPISIGAGGGGCDGKTIVYF